MKKYLLILFVMTIALTNLFAQTAASVQWDCVANVRATTTVGNVVPDSITGKNFTVRDYNGTNSSGPLSSTHQRWWPGKDAAGTGIYWGPESAPLQDRYIQIQVSPKTGNSLTVTKVELSMAAGGTNAMRAIISSSATANFDSPINITDTMKLKQGSLKPEDTLVVYNGSVKVAAGGTFVVRIFPWYTGSKSNSKYVYLQKVVVTGTTAASTAVEQENGLPTAYNLEQNYPNPFNPSTKISFSIPQSGFTRLVVYNLLGKEVAQLVNRNLNAGNYTFEFNANNLPSGLYLYSLSSGNYSVTKKMLLMK